MLHKSGDKTVESLSITGQGKTRKPKEEPKDLLEQIELTDMQRNLVKDGLVHSTMPLKKLIGKLLVEWVQGRVRL